MRPLPPNLWRVWELTDWVVRLHPRTRYLGPDLVSLDWRALVDYWRRLGHGDAGVRAESIERAWDRLRHLLAEWQVEAERVGDGECRVEGAVWAAEVLGAVVDRHVEEWAEWRYERVQSKRRHRARLRAVRAYWRGVAEHKRRAAEAAGRLAEVRDVEREEAWLSAAKAQTTLPGFRGVEAA